MEILLSNTGKNCVTVFLFFFLFLYFGSSFDASYIPLLHVVHPLLLYTFYYIFYLSFMIKSLVNYSNLINRNRVITLYIYIILQ